MRKKWRRKEAAMGLLWGDPLLSPNPDITLIHMARDYFPLLPERSSWVMGLNNVTMVVQDSVLKVQEGGELSLPGVERDQDRLVIRVDTGVLK